MPLVAISFGIFIPLFPFALFDIATMSLKRKPKTWADLFAKSTETRRQVICEKEKENEIQSIAQDFLESMDCQDNIKDISCDKDESHKPQSQGEEEMSDSERTGSLPAPPNIYSAMLFSFEHVLSIK
jgi:hypothetical protein